MDVHRSRFVNYPTSAINALAFSHSCAADFVHDRIANLRLAVGRANGDIEIWNPLRGNWIQEAIFHGGRNRSIEGLVWIQEPDEKIEDDKIVIGRSRLFSIGYSSSVTEWNLETGMPLRNWTGNHSEIWCITAQPVSQNKDEQVSSDGQKIVIGCADGSIVVLSTADGDLQFHKYLARSTSKRARVLSLAFQNSNTVVAGFADGTIRLFDLQNGSLKRTISLGAGPKGGPRDILVWTVKCLSNGNIVSGDSLGEVRIFEKKHFSQIQRIASHDADILDLAIHKATNAIFSAGMDRKTSHYMRKSKEEQWAKTGHSSYHEHDVKAMSSFEGGKLNMIASGGLDTNLVILPMQSHGKEYHLTFSGLPQYPPIDSATHAGLFACWWQQEIHIWKMDRKDRERQHRKVAHLSLKGEENIASASFSDDGSYFAVLTTAELKMFQLLSKSDDSNTLSISQVKIGTKESGRLVGFSPDGKWLAILSNSNQIRLANLDNIKEEGQSLEFKSLNRLHRHDQRQGESLGGYIRTINRMCFSPDSQMLAVSDLAGYIDSWVLQDAEKPKLNGTANHNGHVTDSEDSGSDSDSDDEMEALFQDYVWKSNPTSANLPLLDSPTIAMSFREIWPEIPATRTRQKSTLHPELFVLTANHHLRAFDLSTGSFTEWSKHNPRSVLPEKFQSLRDRGMGMFWGVNGWLWVYGAQWLFGLDTTVDHKPEDPQPDQQSRKRKRGIDGAGGEIKHDEIVAAMPDEESKEVDDEMDIDSDADDFEAPLVNGSGTKLTNGVSKDEERPKWFMTFKYRPILGAVPINQGQDSDKVEVVLVERPLWDLDLPGRFESIHAR